MTHHFVMTSSFRIKNFKIDKFRDFSSDIDYHIRTEIFRDTISLVINQCDPRRPKGASGGHKVSASRAAHASEARLCIYINTNRVLIVRMCILIYHTYLQISSKDDDSSLCYDVIIKYQNFKIDKIGDFSCDIDYNIRTGVFRDVIS